MAADLHRMAAAHSLVRRGCDSATAARAALALHPIDDSAIPGRAFAKLVRKRSRQFARTVGTVSWRRLGDLATEALKDYRRYASQCGEGAYLHRYDQAIGGHDAPPPAPPTAAPVPPSHPPDTNVVQARAAASELVKRGWLPDLADVAGVILHPVWSAVDENLTTLLNALSKRFREELGDLPNDGQVLVDRLDRFLGVAIDLVETAGYTNYKRRFEAVRERLVQANKIWPQGAPLDATGRDQETRRSELVARLCDRWGWEDPFLVAYALFPFDDDIPPSPELRSATLAARQDLEREVNRNPSDQIGLLAKAAVVFSTCRDAANSLGEGLYEREAEIGRAHV